MRTLLIKYILAYLILFSIFISSLVVVSLIPSLFLSSNIGKTVETFKSEGVYPSVGIPWRKITLDNYTDALMFNTAYSVNSSEALQSSMLNMRFYDAENGQNQIDNLETLYEESPTQQVGYERYWHGYLIYLRPLLSIFSYEVIRIINAVFLYGGLLWLLTLAWRLLGKKVTVALIVGFIAIDFFFIWQSLQFSSIFLVAIYSSIYLLQTYKRNKNYYLFFFIIGSLTSFFDLLTAPLITLGLPLLLVVSLQKISIKKIFLYCISWSMGYLLLWTSKWVIVELLFVPGAVQTSFDQIVNRTVTEPDPNFSYINTLKLNIFQLIGYDKSNKITALIIGIISGLFLLKYIDFSKKNLQQIVPWVVIGILPYAWYLVAANHSYLHVWYTYRIQFISVVSFMILYSELIDWNKVKKLL